MKAVLVGAMIVAVSGCQGSTSAAAAKPVTAESVALQAADVPGMLRCDGYGDFESMLKIEKTKDPATYQRTAAEWAKWKGEGASEGYASVYVRSGADCVATTSAGSGTPSGEAFLGFVIKFKDTATAAGSYASDSAMFGLTPNDLTFIESGGDTVTTGSATGLGANSTVVSGLQGGRLTYIAFWQNRSFEVALIADDVAAADAGKLAKAIDGRIH